MPEITDNFTYEEYALVKNICVGHRDYEDTTSALQEKIYSWYLDSGEMPYGVAKARTGDPDAWIYDRLSEEYFV